MSELSKGHWVKLIGRPPWIGQVMSIVWDEEMIIYGVYWLGHGSSWHRRSELLVEPEKP